jgi:hypothetical protein
MRRILVRVGLPVVAVLLSPLAIAAPAAAAPSCVAQSTQLEHAQYGSAWGREVIGFLASHPEVLQEFGFRNLGDLARFAATQDHAACPPDL